MNRREMFAIAPICALCLFLGLMPQPLLNLIQPDIDAVVALYEPTGPQAPTAAIEPQPVNVAQLTVVGNPQLPAPSP